MELELEPKSSESSAMLNVSITEEEDLIQLFGFFGYQKPSPGDYNSFKTKKKGSSSQASFEKAHVKSHKLQRKCHQPFKLKKEHKQNDFHQSDCLMHM